MLYNAVTTMHELIDWYMRLFNFIGICRTLSR